MGKERNEFFKSISSGLISFPVDVIEIGERLIGKNCPVFIIAEVGANHHGKIENALKLIDKAKQAGADAVKFQHLTHDKIAADTVVHDKWHGKPVGTLSRFYKSSELPYEWTAKLVAHARKRGIIFISTPFDKEAVDTLTNAKVDAYKLASYELTDDILLTHIASQNKPIIISTGMATIEEIAHAIRIAHEQNNHQIALLHCTSMYPPEFSDLNLKAIGALSETFKIPVGYSDHSRPPSIAATVAAVTLGACIIEKHITDNQDGGSNDDPNSIQIEDFKNFVHEIRNTTLAISGNGIKQPISKPGHKNDEIFDRWSRRSVYALVDLQPGDKVDENNTITLRPWGGIEPKDFHLFCNRKIVKAIKAREPLTPAHFCN